MVIRITMELQSNVSETTRVIIIKLDIIILTELIAQDFIVHGEEIRNLHSLPNIVMGINLRLRDDRNI
jgi:hypothetical protein